MDKPKYIPTESELLEMGFRNYGYRCWKTDQIWYNEINHSDNPKMGYWMAGYECDNCIEPESQQDILTLIRLFSK